MHNLDQLKDRILKVNKNFKDNFYMFGYTLEKKCSKKIIENIIDKNKNIIIDDQSSLKSHYLK